MTLTEVVRQRRLGLRCVLVLVERRDWMNEILIGEGAELDYAESLRWYAQHSQQAAEGFDIEFSRVLNSIAEHPGIYPLCDARHRYVLLKRYPFQVIFRKVRDGCLLIVAVAHTGRRPGYWSKR